MNEVIKILVVDDTYTNIEILNELLSDKYDVFPAIDGEYALELAKDESPDLILLDIVMPNIDGFEVCRRLKDDIKTKDIPIIFITSKSDELSIEKAYDIGGIDYVTKPFKPKELLAKVNREVKLQLLLKDLENTQKELRTLAMTDPLTTLYNRRYFSQAAEKLIEVSKVNEGKLSTVMIDIDHFKSINDNYGHKAGDEVIVFLAQTLTKMTNQSDIISRFGGEEFVLILWNFSQKRAIELSESIRDFVERAVVVSENNQELRFTISVGISEIDFTDTNPLESSITRADKALYEGKNSGRNIVCFYSKD